MLAEVRSAVPDILITAALPMCSALESDELAIRDSVRLLEGGADLIYVTGMRADRIKKLTYQHIPCVGHLGLVPYFASWTGGFRAMGKTLDEAQELYREAQELDDAGVVCVEMECIPQQLAAYISQRVKFLTYSMGSGNGCDGQYLFSCDLLGMHTGHYPRHSIRYESFYDRSLNAFRKFVEMLTAEIIRLKSIPFRWTTLYIKSLLCRWKRQVLFRQDELTLKTSCFS
jgi:3-methyl-2-oxobutanoate hydroxymethyltransferase